MTIYEIFKKAKEQPSEQKELMFKLITNDTVKLPTYKIIDPYFGFLTQEETDGFCTKNDLERIYGNTAQYKIV